MTDNEKRPLRDGIDTVKQQVGDVAHNARDAASTALDRTKDGVGHAREVAGDVYGTASERAVETLSAARERAQTVAEDVVDRVEASPLVAVVGGVALGVLIGALLPRTARESQLYGAAGQKLNAAARHAVQAAKGAGRDKLADLGLSRDHAGDAVRSIIEAAIAAATSAGSAGFDTIKDRGGKSVG